MKKKAMKNHNIRESVVRTLDSRGFNSYNSVFHLANMDQMGIRISRKLVVNPFMHNVVKLTIKTPERSQRRHSGVFIVNFDHISHLFLVLVLLTLNK